MRIAVLGATGRTGGEFVTQALDGGHEVVAYVRRPEAMEAKPGLTVVGGQLDDADALAQALTGCDAVVVTLGPKMSERNNPLMEKAVPAAINAAKQAGVSRIAVLSALGVGATFENTRYPYRFGARTFLKGNFIDHAAGEDQLNDSGLDWTTVHPGPLANGPKTEHPTVIDAATGYQMPRSPRTRRGDVAATLLSVLDDPETFGKQLLLCSAQQPA